VTAQDLRVNPAHNSRAQLSLVCNPSVVLKNTGLQFTRHPSLHSWMALGEQLFAVADSSTWWIADWLVFGESAFLDRYEEAIRKTQLNYQTLRNYAWVARRFDISRRREELTFGHHAEVAALDKPEQDYWLRKAEEYGWSRNRLRSEVRGSWRERQDRASWASADTMDNGPRAVRPGFNIRKIIKRPARETLELQLTGEQVEIFRSIANNQHLSLDEWAIRVLNATAGYREDL
jgi:hypothetical protein